MINLVVVESVFTSIEIIQAARKFSEHVTLARGIDKSLFRSQSLNAQILSEIDIVEGGHRDPQGLVATLESLAASSPIDAVVSVSEICIEEVSAFCARQGIRFTDAAGVRLAKDKFASKVRLRELGLFASQHEAITSLEDLENAAERVGFPCVLKPRKGAASIGVAILRNATDCSAARSRTLTESMTLEQSTFISSDWVLEEYLQGPMLSIEAAHAAGKTKVFTVGQRSRACHDESIEIGTLLPAPIPDAVVHECQVFAEGVISGLGLNLGIFHIEAVRTQEGLKLIECNPRLMGGSLPHLYDLAYGESIHTRLLEIMCYGRLPQFAPLPQRFGASCFLAALTPGTVPHDLNLSWLSEYDSGAVKYHGFVPPGTPFEATRSNLGYLGRFLVFGPDPLKLDHLRREILDRFSESFGVPFARPEVLE
ncbi:MAG: ATP-grasp domain-containing protein [Silvanigrellales bacterium]|nr:ATP-grasp domain-containing protein [Silvanigrellales bacterium]